MNKFLEIDERLSRRLRVAEKPGVLRTVAVLLGHTGDSWFWIAGLAIIYFTGTDYWKMRALALLDVASHRLDDAINQLGKKK